MESTTLVKLSSCGASSYQADPTSRRKSDLGSLIPMLALCRLNQETKVPLNTNYLILYNLKLFPTSLRNSWNDQVVPYRRLYTFTLNTLRIPLEFGDILQYLKLLVNSSEFSLFRLFIFRTHMIMIISHGFRTFLKVVYQNPTSFSDYERFNVISQNLGFTRRI